MIPLSPNEIAALRSIASPWMRKMLDNPDLTPLQDWCDRRLLSIRESCGEVGISRSKMYDEVSRGRGAPLIHLGPKMTRQMAGEAHAHRDLLIHEGRSRAATSVGRAPSAGDAVSTAS